jgi:predicted nuclease of predicted toxin-antitoxin system
MARLSFLADEHVKRAYVSALRANRFEVVAAAEGEHAGLDDREHLTTSDERGWVILTNDDDFVRLGQRHAHAGIVYYRDQSHRPGDVVTAIRRIDRQFVPEQMHNHIEWLENWL